MHPQDRSALQHIFSVYQHGHSDIEACRNAAAALRRDQAAARVAGEFVVTAIPLAPKGACTFEEFEYMSDPYSVRVDSHTHCCVLPCIVFHVIFGGEGRRGRTKYRSRRVHVAQLPVAQPTLPMCHFGNNA